MVSHKKASLVQEFCFWKEQVRVVNWVFGLFSSLILKSPNLRIKVFLYHNVRLLFILWLLWQHLSKVFDLWRIFPLFFQNLHKLLESGLLCLKVERYLLQLNLRLGNFLVEDVWSLLRHKILLNYKTWLL
jgi:hypothetical protein